MSEVPSAPWIHIGECPVCVNGLCRMRTCRDAAGTHLFALCDECEAIWLEPDTAQEHLFADSESPVCPICSARLYGPQSRWSLPEDVRGTLWAPAAIFSFATGSFSSSGDETLSDEDPPETCDGQDVPDTGDST